MEFYLMRHGKTNFNSKGVLLSNSNPELADLQDPDIVRWVGFLSNISWSYLIYSGMKRTEQTLTIIKDYLAKEPLIISDARLKELYFGLWELKSYDLLYENERELFLKWLDNPYIYSPPEGETLVQLQNRLESFFSEWSNKEANGPILVVTHGGPIRLLWSLINNTPFYDKDVLPSSLFYLNWEKRQMKEISY